MSSEQPDEPLLVLARHVAKEADALGIKTAIIGAMALAVHGYPRATLDVDLGACTSFDVKIRALASKLETAGLYVELRAPDDQDPLDGVLVVRDSREGDKVEVVNLRARIGRPVIERAIDGNDGFRYVRLPELIALKLDAGGKQSLADIDRLLCENPDAEMQEIRKVCAEVGLEAELDKALAD